MHQQAAAAAVAQQQQQQKSGAPAAPGTQPGGSTISQGPQRYNPMSRPPGQPPRVPFTTTPGQLGGGPNTGGGPKRAGFGFKKPGGGPPGAQQPMFYCDVCKISCAGPQTYKVHHLNHYIILGFRF